MLYKCLTVTTTPIIIWLTGSCQLLKVKMHLDKACSYKAIFARQGLQFSLRLSTLGQLIQHL